MKKLESEFSAAHPVRSGFVFASAFPDTSPASGGNERLDEEGWRDIAWVVGDRKTGEMKPIELIKALLNLHDGEVRLVGEARWEPLDRASGGEDIDVLRHELWHYQTMRKAVTREALYHRQRDRKGQDLNEAWVKWILQEEDFQTKLMKFDPAYGGSSVGQWFIRQGNYITLGELFHFGRKMCSC